MAHPFKAPAWRQIQIDRMLMLILLAAIGMFTYLTNAHTLPLRIALDGFSPVQWVHTLLDPAGYAADFPIGVHLYTRSLFMHVYPIAAKWLGIGPDVMVLYVLAFEITCLIAAYACFCRILPGTNSSAVIAVSVLIAIASTMALLDMSRIWRPFYAGQFYNVADAARLTAIVLFVQRRWWPAALFCAFAVMTHPLIGGLALVCMLAMALAAPSIFVNRRSGAALALCVGLAGLWVLSQASSSLNGAGIPREMWLGLTRLMSVHWYTYDLGLLTVSYTQTMLPLLVLGALFFHYLPRMGADRLLTRAYAAGFLSMILLCALGIAFSIWLPEPFLVKLNLQRASMLAVTMATPVVFAGLIQDLRNAPVWTLPAVWALMMSPFFGSAILPAAAALVVLAGARVSRASRPQPTPYDLWCLAVVVLALALLCWAAIDGGAPFWARNRLHLLGEGRLWMPALFLSLAAIAFRFPKKGATVLIPALAMAVTGYVSMRWLEGDHYTKSSIAGRANAYRAVQDWARNNTRPNTLFFVDPLIMYGWRDYSERPSFGNVREWLHTSWLYDSNTTVYREGLKRFGEFGLPLEKYLALPPEKGGIIYSDLDRRHYALGDDWRIDLAGRYGISYFVLENGKLSGTRLPVVFRNDLFVVLDATKPMQRAAPAGRALKK